MHTALCVHIVDDLPYIEAVVVYSARATIRTSCMRCFQEVFEETKASLRDQSKKEFCKIR